MGPTYHHAVEAILEHFVRKLDAAPSVPNGNAEQSPQPPALATPSKNKLVASVRSLMLHRILRKGKGEQRIARIEQHPMQPCGESAFSVGTGGVVDPSD